MKKLSEFKDEKAIEIVADIFPIVMEALADPENRKLSGESNGIKLFSGLFKNSKKQMLEIMAALSETPAEEYHCNAIEVMKNIMTLASDEELLSLFLSQGQMGDAKSSGSVSGNTEEN